MAVELFVARGGVVLVNEIATRPHNSGHHTIEGCVTSQFENHLRGVLDWPLGSTAAMAPAGVPVATMAIGGARNAGLMAVRILGASDPALREAMVRFQASLEAMVVEKDAAVQAKFAGQ